MCFKFGVDRRDKALAMLLFGVAIVWAPCLLNGFASDDLSLVLGRQHHLADIGTWFFGDLWGDDPSGYYRPLMTLGLAFDQAIFGRNPLGYHLHSLLWHLLAVAGLVVMLRGVLDDWRALIAGSVFGLHALQSEAICFISSRNDLMAAALLFWGTAAVLRGRAVLGGVTVLMAMLCKENAAIAVLLIPALSVVPGRPPWRGLAAVLGALGAWALLRFGFGPDTVDPVPPGGWALLMSKAHLVAGLYLEKLLVPWPLTDGETLVYIHRPVYRLVGVAIAAVLFAVVLVMRGGRVALVGLTLLVTGLVPSMVGVAARFLIAERYAYLPVAGLAMAVAAALPLDRRGAVGLGGAVLLWIAAIQHRIPEWRSDLTLAVSAVEDVPTPYTHGWLGRALTTVGAPEPALEWFERALDTEVPYCSVAPDAVRAALAAAAPNEAMRLGGIAGNRGCGGTPGFRGAWALAHLWTGDVGGAERLFIPPPPCDPSNVEAMVFLLEQRGEDATSCRARAESPPWLDERLKALRDHLEVSPGAP